MWRQGKLTDDRPQTKLYQKNLKCGHRQDRFCTPKKSFHKKVVLRNLRRRYALRWRFGVVPGQAHCGPYGDRPSNFSETLFYAGHQPIGKALREFWGVGASPPHEVGPESARDWLGNGPDRSVVGPPFEKREALKTGHGKFSETPSYSTIPFACRKFLYSK